MVERVFVVLIVLLAGVADGFLAPAARRTATSLLRASDADVAALSARLSDKAIVEGLFVTASGTPRQFLRRDQFTAALVAAPGPALSEAAAYECWLGLGGAPKPAEEQKDQKGFFASFAANIASNAAGTVDTRPKDKWGDTIPEMTIIDPALILSADAADDDFSEAAVRAMLP